MSDRGLSYLYPLLTGILMMLACSACIKNEFDIDFSLPADLTRHYMVSYYASDPKQGWIVEDALVPVKGKAQIKGRTRFPSLIFIYGANADLPLVIYAERGDAIKISGSSPAPVEWDAKGNKLTEAISAWRLKYASDLKSGSLSRINADVADYVRTNPSDPASTILLLVYFNRASDEELFHKLWNSLRDDASEKKWSDMMGRSDIAFSALPLYEVPRMALFHTLYTGVDTVRFGSGKPALLYFSRGDVPSRREDIRTLRHISDTWPDSAARIMVEVGFEPDSVSRAWSQRSDSLQRTVKAWMPLGPADSIAGALGVSSLPTFIVVSAKGKVLYRGADAMQAESKFLSTRHK